ncbi:hypothetical protein IEQ34_017480 [Dendrobium chrysotoxum]|uniref:Alpha-carbonic anhydrase domain-containing protein n=1 Tax=Dendrobium chrysotoxum TaxID=161865 RepID=A0AAV7GAB3_DENCH|nr:hypothetical protein IEQ34_017480 [Dendrobium chrysotoxum]
MATKDVFLALGLAFLLLFHVEAHSGFVSFNYAGNGPSNWGNLATEYKSCSSGTIQSPINILQDNATLNTKLHDLSRLYVDANATLINNGFNVMLKFEKSGGLLLQDGKNYSLKELHWHAPSEHSIDTQLYPLELQMVHESEDEDGNVAIVAILYDFGNTDPFLYQLKDSVAQLAKEHCSRDEEIQVPIGPIRTKSLKRHSRRFFKYVGSLTTPPCTENVTWYILGKVRKVSKDQVALIKSSLAPEYQNNARPIQSLNERNVELYDESK